MVRLKGFDAIEFADQEGLPLNKSADSIDEGRSDLSVAEAEAIADTEPDLIWLEVSDEDYYGEPKNMTPGSEDRAHRGPRRAGQRPDELLPGEKDNEVSRESMRGEAAGSPAGGLSASGLAGTTRGSGAPNELDTEDALGTDADDDSNDTVGGIRPQSGRAGGAVGGTPAGKRVSPQ
ncbi:MAG TPA: hypothetical protein VHY91_03170 [Pirellulales bacterium]|jgi:hypothetical protein|nr:hypothetical protein [Pirellulales bacterium]